MTQITIEEATQNLYKLLEQVAKGEQFVLMKEVNSSEEKTEKEYCLPTAIKEEIAKQHTSSFIKRWFENTVKTLLISKLQFLSS